MPPPALQWIFLSYRVIVVARNLLLQDKYFSAVDVRVRSLTAAADDDLEVVAAVAAAAAGHHGSPQEEREREGGHLVLCCWQQHLHLLLESR